MELLRNNSIHGNLDLADAVIICMILMILVIACGKTKVSQPHFNTCNMHFDNPLLDAAACGYTEKLRILVAAGADVNLRDDESGATPLILAIARGHIDTARVLLESGAEVDATDAGGRTALILAARNGQFEGATLLLANGANVNWESEGWTPLVAASTYGGTVEITRLLLENGASKGLQEALILAISTGRIDTMRILIKAGADVNGVYHPLLAATRTGSPEIVNLLLEDGADVNSKDKGGTTALILAALFNYDKIIDILLKAGADVNAITKSDEILDIMVSAGADKGAISETGVTALMLAEKNGSHSVINMLREANVDRQLILPETNELQVSSIIVVFNR